MHQKVRPIQGYLNVHVLIVLRKNGERNIQHKQINNAMQKLHLKVNVMMLEIAYFQVKILQTKQ